VPDGEERRVTGQLVPAGEATVRLRHTGGEVEATADALGRFSARGIEPGPLSLRVERPAPDAVSIETGWVTV
jgi:hypothetical protein